MTESFLTLGLIFISLAIPFALYGGWAISLWALEGAGLIWLGLRQARLTQRLMGLLVIFAGLALLSASFQEPAGFFGLMICSLGALLAVFCYDRFKEHAHSWEVRVSYALLAIAVLCWLLGGLGAVSHYIQNPDDYLDSAYVMSILLEFNISVVFAVLSVTGLVTMARKYNWYAPGYLSLGILPIIVIAEVLYFDIFAFYELHYLNWMGAITWGLAFACHFHLMRAEPEHYTVMVHKIVHVLTAWALYWLIFAEAGAFHRELYAVEVAPLWGDLAFISLSLLTLWAVLKFRRLELWPLTEYRKSYLYFGAAAVVLVIIVWNLWALHLAGDPQPLPYLPILNPLEIMQLLLLSSLVFWLRMLQGQKYIEFGHTVKLWCYFSLGAFTLMFISMSIARSVHFFAGVPFKANALGNSALFQTSISVVWSLVAFSIMFVSSRRAARFMWVVGGVLLAVVVVKLFMFDLSERGSIERIVSFMAVGAFMLVFGYFSPLPAKQTTESPA